MSLQDKLLLVASASAASFFLSLGMVAFVIVRLPPDYFQHEKRQPFLEPSHPLHWPFLIGKNLLGVILVLLGIVLAVPGIPGQGLLTILLGLLCLDFPGKYKVERAILGRRKIARTANRIRARFGKPPFRLDGGRGDE